MKLNDQKIKNVLRSWQESEAPPDILTGQFRKEVELYIYNFPRLAYRKDPDFCSEFYLYVLQFLPAIMSSYPLQADLQFKTWFNYVLRNKLVDLYHKQKVSRPLELDLDDYQDSLAVEAFGDEESDWSELRSGLSRLGLPDRLILQFYYLPESLGAAEMQEAVRMFCLPLNRLLGIRQRLIVLHQQDLERIRELSQRLQSLHSQLREKRWRLYQERSLDMEEKSNLLIQISRLENSRFNLLHRIYAPGKKMMEEFQSLFDNLQKARYRLSMARKKLRFYLLQTRRSLPGGELP